MMEGKYDILMNKYQYFLLILKIHETEYPNLSKMARDYLAVPG